MPIRVEDSAPATKAPKLKIAPKYLESGAVTEALDRQLFISRVRDCGGLAKGFKLKGRGNLRALMEGVIRLSYERGGLARPEAGLVRRILLHTFAVFSLHILAHGWRKPGILSAVARAVFEKVKAHASVMREFTAFVASDRDDRSVVRLSLLLRLLKRHEASWSLLVRRLRSSLPATKAREWLSFFLQEAGEEKAASHIRSAVPARAPSSASGARGSSADKPASGLKYGLIMFSMFDSEVFRSSLRSLVDSDFPGEIVVMEDGNQPESVCRDFCRDLPVTYLKSPTWDGMAGLMNRAIHALPADTDIILYSHNDVLWPKRWFGSLDRAWGDVHGLDTVGILNLGYLEFKRSLDSATYELFTRGEYEDLAWLLLKMREIKEFSGAVKDAQVRSGESPYGMARDPWIQSVRDLIFQTGTFSVGASFQRRVWQEMGEFDPAGSYAWYVEMFHHNLKNKRWSLFINNPPLIHMKSSDTRAATPAQRIEIGGRIQQMYAFFEKKYGCQLEHFLNVYFSETALVHEDRIVRAANRLNFDESLDVFDDFFRRLNQRKLANCELYWCRTRPKCKHV
jgi:hypothetical protein